MQRAYGSAYSCARVESLSSDVVSDIGAMAGAAAIYSPLGSAGLNCLDSAASCYVLERIAGYPIAGIDELLLWSAMLPPTQDRLAR